jgi:hypothetical protein
VIYSNTNAYTSTAYLMGPSKPMMFTTDTGIRMTRILARMYQPGRRFAKTPFYMKMAA